MNKFRDKTYWLVGASEGLGRALAGLLAQQGVELVISARNKQRLKELAGELPGTKPITMDVTDDASVARAYDQLGSIDGIIYCAGAYAPMSAPDWDNQKALRIADVNYMGALRVLGHVVPDFVAADRGHIVIIGSLAGFTGLPAAIGYGSSKAALMHLAEDLVADLRHTNVMVQQINPGFIKTRLTDLNQFHMPQIMTPEDAANRVVHAMEHGRFRSSFPAPFSWLFTCSHLIPRSLFLNLMRG